LRIGINALFLLPGKVGGTETYLRNLVKSLVKIDHSDHEYVVYINKESVGVFDQLASSLQVVLCPIAAGNRPIRILWEQFILPVQIWRHKIDILLSGGLTSPFFCPATSILALHDIQHVNQPRNYSWLYHFFLKTIIYWSAKTADGIITISHKVKQDIIRSYKIPRERICVTHLAADHHVFFPRNTDEVESARKKYRLPQSFLLYPASSLAHKNHQRLFEAMKLVTEAVKETHLVLIGPRNEGANRILASIAGMDLQKDILLLDWLPFEDIPLLYCASQLLVYPSLDEGFGLPILEAMACGIPVVCSRIEPMTEVAGDAAIYVDPYDPKNIAEGVLSVLKNDPVRQRFIEYGLKRSKEFGWDKTASSTLSFLNSHRAPNHQ
jgi:glycosyltransferase involved in cell wall biosynthesis